MTLGLKYKLDTLIFKGARHHLISDAHSDRAHKFLVRASVPDAHDQHVLKGTDQFLTRMLSNRISS